MRNISITILVALAVSYGAISFNKTSASSEATSIVKAETAYERVMRTKTLRCGYFIESPFTELKDGKEFTGLAVDLTKEIAKGLGLKVEWTTEIGFSTFSQDLKNNRYDMVCSGIFILPRGGTADHTIPYAYVPIRGYASVDDTRFDKPMSEIDWANITISGIDSEGATTAAQKLLPQAKMQMLPQLASVSEILVSVAANKADIGFVLPSVFANFNKTNPNKLKPIATDKALYTYAVAFSIANEQYALKSLINNALTQLIVSGELEAMFRKYDPDGLFSYPKAN